MQLSYIFIGHLARRYHQRFLKKQRGGSHAENAFIFYHSCFKSVGKKAEFFTRKETTFERKTWPNVRNIDGKEKKKKKKIVDFTRKEEKKKKKNIII